jgi:translation elongation factor EF-Ts
MITPLEQGTNKNTEGEITGKAEVEVNKSMDFAERSNEASSLIASAPVFEDASEDDEDPAVAARNRQEIIEWVVDQDFTKDFSLASLAEQKFRLDDAEMGHTYSQESILKILKVLYYKIGTVYHR